MKQFFGRAFLALMILLLYLPIFVLAVYSFTDSANIGAIHGFTLKNYETLFTKPDLRAMILGTLVLAIGSAFVSTVLGTLGAVGSLFGALWECCGGGVESGSGCQCGGGDSFLTVYSFDRRMRRG